MKKIPLRAAGGGVFALALLTLLFAFPFACIEGIRAGLASCTQQVIPALFPLVRIAGIAAVVIRAGVYAAISGGGVSAHPFLIGRTVSRRIDPVIGMDLSVALLGIAVCIPSGFIHWFPIRIFSVVVHKATPHISLTAIRLL